MNINRSMIAWILFGVIFASVIIAIVYDFNTRPPDFTPPSLDFIAWFLPLSFALVGGLIITRQPRNIIGWLMMGPGLSFFLLVDILLRPYLLGFSPPPKSPTPIFLLTLWFSNWNWLLLVFPLMFIMVLFPTGRPINRRWGWLMYFGIGLIALIFLISTFSVSLAPGAGGVDWSYRNPIGFLEPEWIEYIVPPFMVALPVWVILCVFSLIIRFRQAHGVEREQIKWLFYAAAIFALSYVPTFIFSDFSDSDNFWNILWMFGMFVIPAGIAIAILRYRLYDIDIIIRRTLQYVILTGLLVMLYLGVVIVLESIIGAIIGPQSAIVIVISTLLIAALFNPLRLRVQDFIDRRLYRKKYDAEITLSNFASYSRDEVELEKLALKLLDVVEETMKPESAGLWIKRSGRDRKL